MKKILFFAALLLSASPVAAVTSSADLETLAKTLEQNPVPNATLNSRLLSLVREPAKTLDGVTLPSTASQYTTLLDTALKLRPKGWFASATERLPETAGSVTCTAYLSYWVPAATSSGAGLRTDVFAWGGGNCPSVLSAAIARAWAWKLKQVGR
jgi:hypothetical protein